MNLEALHKLSYGLYVIGSRKDDRLNGQIANTVFHITSEPPTIAVSINKDNLTHGFIKESRAFSVSVLDEDTPLSLIGHFGFRSGRDMDKLEGIESKTGQTKAPVVLEHTVAYLEAKVVKEVDVGTHTVFIGEVVGGEVISEGACMTYDYYHRLKGGLTPKTAPSYIEQEEVAAIKASKYRCTVCGYVYDPELGDPDGGIAPGVPFGELPDEWVCPVCGAAKSQFEKME